MPSKDPIKKVELANGRTRYRFVIDVGRKPSGSRDQKTYTYDTLKEARAERAAIIAARGAGTYVRPTTDTVAELCATWLAGKRNLRPGTRRTYGDSLRHATDRIGGLPAQAVTKKHIDRLVTELLVSGRRVGNRQTQALSARTVNVMLTLLQAVFEDAVRQGSLGRNVVALVERPSHTRREMSTWTAADAAAFLRYVAADRLHAAWRLSLYGLRRGEVCGLRWSDVDFQAGTISITWTRTVAGYSIVEGPPKTQRSRRTLVMGKPLAQALRDLRDRQVEERADADTAYAEPCSHCQGRHVLVNELGEPYRPEWYGDRFAALVEEAKLPAIRLHDTRHTCGTLMHLEGVPTAVISAWLGHASAAFTLATYVHAQDPALVAAEQTLGRALDNGALQGVRRT